MNARKLIDDMALAAWRLAEAEALERRAANHRRAAAAILAEAHAEAEAALAEVEDRRRTQTREGQAA